ncbi:MAG: ankyrin repeat domain-containing protein [Pyrinomonadaceae bacterium]
MQFGDWLSSSTPASVSRNPFEAQLKQVIIDKRHGSQVPHQVLTGSVHRDIYGRVRKELRLEIASRIVKNIAFIFDPNIKTTYVVDIRLETIIEKRLPSVPETLNLVDEAAPLQSNLSIQDIPIEQRQIEGLTCHGYQEKSENVLVETWYSDELKEVLLKKHISENAEITLELFDIRRVEPDSNLFIIPSNYRITSEVNKHDSPSWTLNINAKFDDERYLNFASGSGDLAGVRELILKGANVNEERGIGRTALMNAAEFDRTEIVKILLAAGSNTETRTELGTTPLMCAAAKGNTQTIYALLEGNADLTAKDVDGMTALAIAARHGHLTTTKALLDKGSNPNIQDRNGTTVLMHAVASRNVQIIVALLAAGANVQVKSSLGATALSDALNARQTSIVQLLKEAGANE